MTTASSLTVIVAHFRGEVILKGCLEKLFEAAPDTKVIIVNTGPEDLTESRNLHPQTTILSAPNHSYSAAVNTGLYHVETEFVLQMNSDVFVDKYALSALLQPFSNEKVGVTGPRCFNGDGKLQRQGLPYLRYHLWLKLTRRPSLPVSWVSGCCQLFRMAALRHVGGFNSSYRFYNEDLELCWRLRRAGWQCQLVNAPITHLGGSSTPADPKFIVEGYRGGMVFAHWYRPAWQQRLQRWAVLLEARLKSRAEDQVTREASGDILEMFRREAYDESPFGKTLSDANPNFLTSPEPHQEDLS